MTLRDQDDFDPTDIEQADDDGMLGERALGVTEYGVTAEEERTPETLEERLRREEPDVMVGMGQDAAVGRLVEEDQGVAGLDKERDPVATEVDDRAEQAAEETAVHETDLG